MVSSLLVIVTVLEPRLALVKFAGAETAFAYPFTRSFSTTWNSSPSSSTVVKVAFQFVFFVTSVCRTSSAPIFFCKLATILSGRNPQKSSSLLRVSSHFFSTGISTSSSLGSRTEGTAKSNTSGLCSGVGSRVVLPFV